MSFANVGKKWSTSSFPEYLKGIKRPSWVNSVCIHHTAAPSLATRPSGLTSQHIENIRDFYKDEYGWNRGPHLFTDDDDIFGMTPLTVAGIHAVSFNSRSIGIEALGNYDKEDPLSGRGLAVMQTTASAARALFDWMGLVPTNKNLLFHRFDPKTTKTCPGTRVQHEWFLKLVLEAKPGQPHDLAGTEAGGIADQKWVPLIEYVSQHAGVSQADLIKLMRRDGAMVFLGEQWIEAARYDKATQTTLAPIGEANEAVAVLRQPLPNNEKVPMVSTLAAKFGLSYAETANLMKTVNGLVTWGGQHIAGAQYDRASQTTVAPFSSLQYLKKP